MAADDFLDLRSHAMDVMACPTPVEALGLPTKFTLFEVQGAVFQMAEVAVPRELFDKILRLIDGLRRRSAPA